MPIQAVHPLSNHDLLFSLKKLVQEERRLTQEILGKIHEVEKRKLYAELGYPSIYEWLVKDLGYSHGAAYRRLQASRLLATLPETAESLQSGSTNLTTLSQVQSAIRSEEKRRGEKLALQEKKILVEQVKYKSSQETEGLLAQIFPESKPQQDTIRPLNQNDVRLSVTLTQKQLSKLRRVQELASHSLFNASLGEIIEMLAEQFIRAKDPLVKNTVRRHRAGSSNSQDVRGKGARKQAALATTTPRMSAPDSPADSSADSSTKRQNRPKKDILSSRNPARKIQKDRSLPASVKKQIWRRDGGACTYKHPLSGKICGSRSQIEIDHIRPRALGGGDEVNNLRCLCRTHNLLMAERSLGIDKIRRFQKNLH